MLSAVTVGELLATGAAALRSSSDSPEADAALLLAHVLRRDRAWLVAHVNVEPSVEEADRFQSLCDRRRTGVPIAYLIESAWFYGREFIVNEHVLVPRPETEHLIDEALRFIDGPMRVLDVGTGSGAIACTIAAETRARVEATDISASAVAIARENAQRLVVSDRCVFHRGDLVEPVGDSRYDVVIANLPYIPTRDLPAPPDPTSFEPRLALDGGRDGLAYYRRLLAHLPPLLNENALALFECAPPTIRELLKIVEARLGDVDVTVINDYAGLPRCVRAQRREDACIKITRAPTRADPQTALE